MSHHETRRRFISTFAGVGLGGTLLPGVLWAEMQQAGTDRITPEMVGHALKLSGIEMTDAERDALVRTANQNLTRYEEFRKIDIPIDVSPAVHFIALAPGVDVD